MADVSISYKGNEIASMNATGVKTLLTGSAFCEDDITVTYTKPAAPVPSLQTKSATYTPSTSQQTASITADAGYDALGEVNVTVDGIVCTNLTAENIADGVTVKIGTATDDDSVASVTGTHQGGGGASTTNVSFKAGDLNTCVYYVDSNGTAQTWAIDPIDPDTNFSATVPSKSLLTATCRSGAPSNYSNCSLITTRTGGNGNTKYVCIIQAD